MKRLETWSIKCPTKSGRGSIKNNTALCLVYYLNFSSWAIGTQRYVIQALISMFTFLVLYRHSRLNRFMTVIVF